MRLKLPLQVSDGMLDELGKVEYSSMLYDFYGALLSDSQNEVMALYHEDNLSLSEIAGELGMSRQAVHYTLKKAETSLAVYEDKLGLVASYIRNRKLAERARTIIEEAVSDKVLLRELTTIINRISE